MANEKQESPTTTSPVSLTTLQPDVLGVNLQKVRTVNDALALPREQYPSLAVLRRNYGNTKIEAIIKLYLIDLCENVNLKRPLRDSQVDNIAREIVAEYYSLTVADVYVVFKKAKTGEYGEFYESLDMPKVMSWFRDYFADRCSLAAQDSISGRFRDPNDPRQAEQARKHFEILEKQFNKGKK